ncbi:MAG TPA: (2Fe-2S)-binding protein [Vicinamibacterales bacterium]|nr:(2Fe-2S)-binding protein [Vicinamibacterales bacterium]
MALKDDPSVESTDPAQQGSGFSVSRRAFLQSIGVTSVAAGVLGTADAEAQTSGPPKLGPGAVPVTLRVNGKTHELPIEPRVTLLDALRDRLEYTGLKRVCDRGSCGACTAIVDGRPVYSCSMLAIEAQGKDIRTVEGLVEGTILHPVQQALCDHDGTMCGFCTPGFVMAAVSLLEKNPSPSKEEARAALDGNICRCGTYPQVLEAVLSVKGVRRG